MTGAIEILHGRGLPLWGDDIDTDQIIESKYLRMTTFRGLGKHVFESQRTAAQTTGGKPHPFEDARFAGASVLLVGCNFGCGSSREHAPQALFRFGIRAIVGASFGEIFADNCLTIGMPCLPVVSADADRLRNLSLREPVHELTLDIRRSEVIAAGRRIAFDLPEGRRSRLLDGSWDSLNLLLSEQCRVEVKLDTLPPVSLTHH